MMLPTLFALAAHPSAPPRGWRSWNAFRADINQTIIEAQVHALVSSGLLAAGYKEVGIDMGWEGCGLGVNGSYHDEDGSPLVDLERFPDLAGLVSKAQAMGVGVGIYMNGCTPCTEQERALSWRTPVQDIAFTAAHGFSGLKIDGCGPNHPVSIYTAEVKRRGLNVTVENCADNAPSTAVGNPWTPATPADVSGDACTFDFYRVSTDIAAQFYSTVFNLQKTSAFNSMTTNPLSRPGCFAYPDMSQVARLASAAEDRAHFAAWCIVSSPQVLGFDLADGALVAHALPIVTNAHALRVNSEWAGHPGRLVRNSTTYFVAGVAHGADGLPHRPDCHVGTTPSWGCTQEMLPMWQLWAKPLLGGDVALLVLNVADAQLAGGSVTFTTSEVGFAADDGELLDVWSGTSSRVTGGAVAVPALGAHEGFFAILSSHR
jgi:alpha-galactosidase